MEGGGSCVCDIMVGTYIVVGLGEGQGLGGD